MIDRALLDQAESFAADVTEVLQGALPDAPEAAAEVSGDRAVIEPSAVELYVEGRPLATLNVLFRCQLDTRGTWLAIQESAFRFSAKLDRTPILRFEYVRDPKGGHPAAHLQVHAHRGALSHLLSQARHESAHDMSGLHIPVGGARFRPCLEDVIEFLVVECGFDRNDTWREAVIRGRERWRRLQLRAAARDLPDEAAGVLEELGYRIERPSDLPPESSKALHAW